MIASNRLLVISRMICAIALIALATTDPFDAGFQFEFDDTFALAFGLWTFATTLVSLRRWFVDFTASGALIAVDAVAFAILIFATTPADDATIAAAYCLMAHVIFASVLRWPTARILPAAFAIGVNVLLTLDIAAKDLQAEALDTGHAARTVLFGYFLSAIVFWVGRQLARPLPARFRIEHPVPGLPLTACAIPYVQAMTGAGQIRLCHYDRFDARTLLFDSQRQDAGFLAEELDFSIASASRQLEPMIFDLQGPRALMLHGGTFHAIANRPVPGTALLKHLGADLGICMPITTDEGTDWFILTEIPLLGWGHLKLCQAICHEVQQEVSSRIAAEQTRDAALGRLRQTIARDLHDSVAHSLAGAKYLLTGLRSRLGEEHIALAEIDSIRSALDAEHSNVRELIAQLRETDPESGLRDFMSDLNAIIPNLAARWQTGIAIEGSDYRVMVPGSQSLELQQLVREAVSNGARHGGASRIAITCRVRGTRLELVINDNGAGFALADNQLPRSISERVRELGGETTIESEPGSTTLHMAFPRANAHPA